MTVGEHFAPDWLNEHLSRPRALAVDIETYGLGQDMLSIKCVSLGVPEAALILDPRRPLQAGLIQRALAYAPTLIMHVATADAPSLCANHLMRPQDVDKVVDTVLYARLAEPGETVPKRLEDCARRYLGLTSDTIADSFKALGYSKTDGYRVFDIDRPAYVMGAAADGIVTARLLPAVRAAAMERFTRGHPFADRGLNPQEAVLEMEKSQIVNRLMLRRTIKGLRIDLDFMRDYVDRTGPAREAGEVELRAVGVKPGNGNQLAQYLTEINALPTDHPRTKTGRPSTQAKHLEMLKHPLAKLFVQTKQISKLLDDYLVKCRKEMDDSGRIHPTVSVLAAAHGRMSMAGIPLHQFPPGARGIVLFDEGDEGGGIDWAQQEPVVALNSAGDVDALQGYEQRGEKLYYGIASFANIPYNSAKKVLLAGMYGEGLRKLSSDLDLDPGPWHPRTDRDTGQFETDEHGEVILYPQYAAARDIQDAAFSTIPKTKALLETLRETAKKHRLICTMNGRILPIPMGVQPWDGKYSVQAHKGPNFYISGSATDMMYDALCRMVAQGLSEAFYLGMHDELIVSRGAVPEVRRIMETPSPRLIAIAKRVPIIRTDTADLGIRWQAT
jgi:DNA polymerase-1